MALIDGRAVAGDRPERSGRRPGPRSTSRSIPTTRQSDHGEYARLPPRAGHAQHERRALAARSSRRPAGPTERPDTSRSPGTEKEHNPRISRPAELAIDSQTQHIAIETKASIEVCGAQQNPAAQDVHVPILAHCPAVADAKASILICRFSRRRAMSSMGGIPGSPCIRSPAAPAPRTAAPCDRGLCGRQSRLGRE